MERRLILWLHDNKIGDYPANGIEKDKREFFQGDQGDESGQDVILTERGKPIAVIKPLEQEKSVDATMRRLEAEGVLRRGPKNGKPMPVWRSPVRIKGKPISDTISEERDER